MKPKNQPPKAGSPNPLLLPKMNTKQNSINSDDSSLLPSGAGHTPTPWNLDSDDIGMWINAECNPIPLAKMCTKNNAHSHEANAAFIVRAVNSHDALVGALEDAKQALGVARASLKTAHHCMNSAEYSSDETKFTNARDLVYTAFVGVSATEDRTRAALEQAAK